MQAARPVLNGGDEETGLLRPRLVATQLRRSRFHRRLTPGVRRLSKQKVSANKYGSVHMISRGKSIQGVQ